MKKTKKRRKTKKKILNMEKRKTIFYFLIIISMALVIGGFSYAWWYLNMFQEKKNVMKFGCFTMELSNEQNKIDLINTYPISNEEGLKLKPFSFTISNTCSLFSHYTINLEILKDSTLDGKFVATRVNSEKIRTLDTFSHSTPTLNDSLDSYILAEGYLGSGDSIDYSVSLWMDENVTVDDDTFYKVLNSKIVVVASPSDYNPYSAGYQTLYDAILANEYQVNPELAKEKISQKLSVDITNTAPIVNWFEKRGATTTKTIMKIAESVINSDEASSNLSKRNTMLKLYRKKTFDEDTAMYTLSDYIFADPTTITDYGVNHYYIRNEYINYNQSSKKLYDVSETTGREIYEITGATKSNTKTMWNNTNYDSITYNLDCVTLTSNELEVDKSDKGLYQANDDYGLTYYYRGNVKNNNVYFAGLYWQIIRINGDGSIRLMYNGKHKESTGLDQAIDNYKYQFNELRNSPIYAGYMYGNINSSSLNELYDNIYSSKAKTTLEKWYKSNIVDKGYSSFISDDVGFCSDRSIFSGDGINLDQTTSFGANGRSQNNSATFLCPNNKDLFTSSTSKIGNHALTYPVGLITYDELVYAGMDSKHINRLSWVYSSENYWTMSPSYYYSSNKIAYTWSLNSDGNLSNNFVSTSRGLRPVVNLIPSVKISGGIGTKSDPFVIEES